MSDLNIQKPNASVTVTLQDNQFTIGYPKAGEIIDIAILKAKLSDNQYSYLNYQFSQESGFAVKLIDSYAFFTTMIPDLKKKLAKSLYDLTAEESLEIIHSYEGIVTPWLNAWTEYLNNRIDELKGESGSKRDLV